MDKGRALPSRPAVVAVFICAERTWTHQSRGGRAGEFALDRDGRIVLSAAQQQAIRMSPKPVQRDVQRPVPLRDFTRMVRRMREE